MLSGDQHKKNENDRMVAKAPPVVNVSPAFSPIPPPRNAFSQGRNREKSTRLAGSLAGRLGRGPLGWLDRSTDESPVQRENVARHASGFSTCVGSSSRHLRPMADSCCPDPGVGHYNDAGHPDNEPRWYDVLKRHQTSKMCHSGPKQGQWTCRETAFRHNFCTNFQ